jgi:hypothetical protein
MRILLDNTTKTCKMRHACGAPRSIPHFGVWRRFADSSVSHLIFIKIKYLPGTISIDTGLAASVV